MIKIIPSILSNDRNEVFKMIRKIVAAVEEGAPIDRVQIDIIDGQFAKNRTIEPTVMQNIETDLNLDFHLMTKEPSGWIEKCASSGADRIIGQVEMMKDQVEFIEKVQITGCKVGLALDLETSVDELDKSVLTDLDVVLVMSVAAGFGGQKFDSRAMNKIKKLDEIRSYDKTPFAICDDGGITFEYIDDLRVAGVDEVAIGKRLFSGDLKENTVEFISKAFK